MKIYVGTSLTQAPDSYRTFAADIRSHLKTEYEVLDFLGITEGTPNDVYRRDIQECLAHCDAFIALCDYPAIGLGYEIGTAVEHLKKPTLALAHTDAHVTRLVLGINAPHYRFERYQNTEHLLSLVRDFTKNVTKK